MKTYKRETAFLVLCYLSYLGLYGRIEVVEILAWPLMLFVGTAFGMDWAGKQTTLTSRKVNELDNK